MRTCFRAKKEDSRADFESKYFSVLQRADLFSTTLFELGFFFQGLDDRARALTRWGQGLRVCEPGLPPCGDQILQGGVGTGDELLLVFQFGTENVGIVFLGVSPIAIVTWMEDA